MEFPHFKKFNLAELEANEKAFQDLQDQVAFYKGKSMACDELRMGKRALWEIIDKERGAVVAGLLKISELESQVKGLIKEMNDQGLATQQQATDCFNRLFLPPPEPCSPKFAGTAFADLFPPNPTMEFWAEKIAEYVANQVNESGRKWEREQAPRPAWPLTSNWEETAHFKVYGEAFNDLFTCYIEQENPLVLWFVLVGNDPFDFEKRLSVEDLKDRYQFDFLNSKEAQGLPQ